MDMAQNWRSCWSSLFWLSFLMSCCCTEAKDLYLEAENSLIGDPLIVHRPNASGQQTVRLSQGGVLQIGFCLKQRTVVRVQTVLYSNRGGETLVVSIDQTFVGYAFTRNGLLDVVTPSPSFNRNLTLSAGWHALRVGVFGPSSGVVEIDAVVLTVSDEGLSQAVLGCTLLCQISPPADVVNSTLSKLIGSDTPVAQVRQASYPTRCAEEDNIKLPLYSPGIKEYNITAMLPNIINSANNRHNNDTNCPHLSPVLWQYPSIRLPHPNQTFSLSGSTSTLIILRNSSSNVQTLRVDFELKGRSEGHVDADMGSTLTFRFDVVRADIDVKLSFLGRNNSLTPLKDGRISARQSPQYNVAYKVTFPDFTWREKENNVVVASFHSSVPIHVTHVDMERRPMTGEKVSKVYDANGVVVETVEIDFWWRRPEMMTLRNGENGQSWRPVDMFRVYLKKPWSNDYVQVLVVYQDGNFRIAPFPPLGIDWIPFGSSVIVGNSNPNDLRPSAPITSVTFHPSTLEFEVQYLDGGEARLRLVAGATQTTLMVNVLQSGKGPSAATSSFATVRSMYVEDGNSDIDSILVDGRISQYVMDNFSPIVGSSFFFYRRCESVHLTLAPDITIDVIRTNNGVISRSNQVPLDAVRDQSRWWWWDVFSGQATL